MNSKMFDEDFEALFDNDQQFDIAINATFHQMDEAQKENPMEDVLAIWEKVAKTETEINALTKQQPEYQKYQKSIEEELKKYALAKAEVKSAMEQKQQLNKALAKKRRMMYKLIPQQDAEVPEAVVNNIAEIVHETRQELYNEKMKIHLKQSLLELGSWNGRRKNE